MTVTDRMTTDVAARAASRDGPLPAAEDRPGQRADGRRGRPTRSPPAATSSSQAGTGTGKTLGYLVPGVVMGKRMVVATATKALQDQLASKDLPFLQAHLGRPFEWAVLKGRSNYVCMQRLREIAGNGEPARASSRSRTFAATTKVEIKRLAAWVGHHRHRRPGRARLGAARDTARQAVSVGSDECPGATRCPLGGRLLRRDAHDSGPRSPTWSSSTCTSTGCTWAAAA